MSSGPLTYINMFHICMQSWILILWFSWRLLESRVHIFLTNPNKSHPLYHSKMFFYKSGTCKFSCLRMDRKLLKIFLMTSACKKLTPILHHRVHTIELAEKPCPWFIILCVNHKKFNWKNLKIIIMWCCNQNSSFVFPLQKITINNHSLPHKWKASNASTECKEYILKSIVCINF